ncbi:MAG TPA: SDR family NAD(P)-dependent oxidoreductase [Capillimicrobium sp.]|nr:SDR family NAD(P)-dependent oxidoreductase [Capillimicrobium sp.]
MSVALVTGSTRGIGLATARRLAEDGFTVVVNGTDEAAARERADELGGDALAFDVSDADAVNAAVRELFQRHKRLDVLVNNAGVLDDALLGMIKPERTFAINTMGVLNTMQACARLIARGGGGSIVNVASIIGVTGNVGQVAYGGSKAAVIGMTKSAAKELAPKQIRVNAVAPGFIDTDMTRALPKETFDERVASVGLGRAGTPEEVADAIAWLASDRARYVTGQVIGVDGGMVI